MADIRTSVMQARGILDDVLAQIDAEDKTLRVGKTDPPEYLQKAVDAAPQGGLVLAYPRDYPPLKYWAGVKNVTIRPDSDEFDLTKTAPTRITPDHAPGMIRLTPDAAGLCLSSEQGAVGYTLIGTQLSPLAKAGLLTMASLGTDTETVPQNQPSGLVFDRCLVMANPDFGVRHGISANTGFITIQRSYFDHIWGSNDAQAIATWNGPGPFNIDDNYLAAAAEAFIAGGGTPVNASMMPLFVSLTGNWITKRSEWMGKTGCTVKCGPEIKCALRTLIEGNLIENVWGGQGQNGYAVLLTPRNQDDKSPYVVVSDVTIQYNVIRNIVGALNILGTDNEHPSQRTTNVKVLNNLIYGFRKDIGQSPWGMGVQLGGGPKQVEFGYNTMINVNNSFLVLSGTTPADTVNWHHNALDEGGYGIKADGQTEGLPSWTFGVVNGTFDSNIIRRGSSGRNPKYPGTNQILPNLSQLVGPDFKLAAGLSGAGADIDAIRARVAFV